MVEASRSLPWLRAPTSPEPAGVRCAAITRATSCRRGGCTTGRLTTARLSFADPQAAVAHAVLHLGVDRAVRRLAPARRW